MGQQGEMPVYDSFIGSDCKAKGLEKVLQSIPVLHERIAKGVTTDIIVRLLHALSTDGASLPEFPDLVAWEQVATILFNAGVSADALIVLTSDICSQREKMQALLSGSLELRRKSESVKVGMPRMQKRGYLRSIGFKQCEIGEKKTVYMPIQRRVGDDKVFSYPEFRLHELFKSLCTSFDKKWKDAVSLDDKLRAISYFQLWGFFIHPFCDGNGRAFDAHLVLMLKELGFDLDEYPHFRELMPNMTSLFVHLQVQFGDEIMALHNIPFVPLAHFQAFSLTRNVRENYHSRMYTAVKNGIEERYLGEVGPYIEAGVDSIKAYLSKKGLLGDGGALYQTLESSIQ